MATALGETQQLRVRRLIVVTAVLFLLGFTLAVPVRTYFSQASESRRLTAENQVLVRDIRQYQWQQALHSDPKWVEAQARDRLQYIRPGETAYVVQVPNDAATTSASVDRPNVKGGSWYTEMWNVLSTPQ